VNAHPLPWSRHWIALGSFTVPVLQGLIRFRDPCERSSHQEHQEAPGTPANPIPEGAGLGELGAFLGELGGSAVVILL